MAGRPWIKNKLTLIENSSIGLFCNATALPNSISYKWFFNDKQLGEYTNSKLLSISNLKRHQAGNYTCKCFNKHGEAHSQFRIEILCKQRCFLIKWLIDLNKYFIFVDWKDAQLVSLNKATSDKEGQSLRQPKAIYINSNETASLITLNCKLDSNSLEGRVDWHFFQLDKQGRQVKKAKISSRLITAVSKGIQVDASQQMHTFSQLRLESLNANNSGYYACSVQFTLKDDLNQTELVAQNATYYLNVQCESLINLILIQYHSDKRFNFFLMNFRPTNCAAT